MKKILILALISIFFARETDKKQEKKTYTKSVETTQKSIFNFSVPNGSDVVITKSPDNKVYLNVTIEITDNKKSVDELPNEIDLLKVIGNRIEFDRDAVYLAMSEEHRPGFFERLVVNVNEGSINTINGTSYYKKDGKTYLVPSHIMTFEVKLPELNEIYHKNKYGTSTINNIAATYIEFDMYETKLILEDAIGQIEISNKYSEAEIRNIQGNFKADFYSLDVEISNVKGDLDMTNKYAKALIRDVAGKANIEGYELDLSVDKVGETLDINNKYGPTTISNIGSDTKLTLYECTAKIINVNGNLTLDSKYDPTTIDNVSGDISLALYESDLTIDKVGKSISGEMKYGFANISDVKGPQTLSGYSIKYNFKNIADLSLNYKYGDFDLSGTFGNLELDSYEGDISIVKTFSGMPSVVIKKKYGDITLSGFDYKQYRIRAKAKQGKIKISELRDDLNDDKDELRYQWSNRELKTIDIDGYGSDISLN